MNNKKNVLRLTSIFVLFLLGWQVKAQETHAENEKTTTIGLAGQNGILRTYTGAPLVNTGVRAGMSFEYFKTTDFLTAGDENEFFQVRFVVSAMPVSGLEITSGFLMKTNRNIAFEPAETQSIGDPFLGIRYGYALSDLLSLGLALRLDVPTGERSFTLSTDAFGFLSLASLDVRPSTDSLVILNVGYYLDNTSKIFGYELNEAQRFTAGISLNDHLLLQLGATWRFGPVAPFFEWGMAYGVAGPDLAFNDNPNWVTVGLRAWPFANHPMHLIASVDIGLAGIHVPSGAGRIAPYCVLLGFGYDFGARSETKAIESEKIVYKECPTPKPEPPAPKPKIRIVGQVKDAVSQKPIAGAVVVVDGDEPSRFVSVPEDGRFHTCPQDPGPTKLTISMDGYKTETVAVVVSQEPTTLLEVALHPLTGKTIGRLKGTVRSVKGKPLQALISIPTRKITTRTSKRRGAFSLELETGVFDVLVSKPGYITQRQKIKLKTGEVVIINVELYPKK